MTRTWRLGISLLLLIASLPLISVGMDGDRDTLWTIGLVLLAAGGLVALLTRDGRGRKKEKSGQVSG